MKKVFIYYIVFIFSISFANAETYFVSFKDKGVNVFLKPTQFLGQKSIDRRIKSKVEIDYTDFPVCNDYIQKITAATQKIYTQSKWLNGVVVEATHQQLAIIIQYNFVKDITELSFKKSMITLTNNTAANIGFCPSDFALPQLDMLNATLLHHNGYTGKGIIICVMDDGFKTVNTMNTFAHLYTNKQILATWNFETNAADLYHTGGHGTAVLSQIVGKAEGLLRGTGPDVSLLLTKTENEGENPIEMYQWVAAAEWADSMGADIFSTSLGYTQFDNKKDNYYYADMDGHTTPISKAAILAARKGILVVNSAGNEGWAPWHYISAPADADSILTVGAVDANGYYIGFSSVGPTWDGRIKPDVVTMGHLNVVATANDILINSSGTSFSCPILSGLAACIWQADTTLSSFQIRDIIKQTASRASHPDNEYGWGIPDASLAIEKITGKKLLYPADCSLLDPNGFIITPNPYYNGGVLSITVWEKNMPTDYSMEFYTADGKLTYTANINTVVGLHRYAVNTPNNMQPGLYFIKLLQAEQIIKVEKLIVF
ncbi:MAG: S8 family serine peptidase [Bacteroidota bacterium]|nr:S8 family serine peptidase [Bacteroidota bacterium]